MGRKVKARSTKTIRAKVALTTEEVAKRADMLAELLGDIDAQKEALKVHAKSERAEIKEKEQDARRLRDAVSTHEEERDVEVTEEVRGGVVYVTRIDTGEVVEQREASAEDRQTAIFDA